MTKLDWESKRNIEEVVDQIAFSRVRRFYPTYVQKVTGIPLNEVFNFLLTLVEDGRLILKWEIRCPDFDCNSIIIRTEKIEDYLHETIECDHCGDEVLVRESLVFPAFEINEHYRAEREKLKKRRQSIKSTIKKQINPGNERVSLNDIDLLRESKESINRIQQTNIYIINGDGAMINSRKMGDISDSNFSGNTNFQGDDANQQNIEQTTVLQNALNDLKKEIESISDEDNKEDASIYYDSLLKYIEENKPTRIEKCLSALKGVVGTAASILTIAPHFGIVL